jgi:hypothetical protein
MLRHFGSSKTPSCSCVLVFPSELWLTIGTRALSWDSRRDAVTKVPRMFAAGGGKGRNVERRQEGLRRGEDAAALTKAHAVTKLHALASVAHS